MVVGEPMHEDDWRVLTWHLAYEDTAVRCVHLRSRVEAAELVIGEAPFSR